MYMKKRNAYQIEGRWEDPKVQRKKLYNLEGVVTSALVDNDNRTMLHLTILQQDGSKKTANIVDENLRINVGEYIRVHYYDTDKCGYADIVGRAIEVIDQKTDEVKFAYASKGHMFEPDENTESRKSE